ncbi:MAG TPA: oxidoreductase, partial [Candidatus Limnocylindria bacterium]|nr:oxidoreductase [Candidatus Limnocylindria bacterium]
MHPSRRRAAAAGLVAGGVGLAVSELLAGVVDGAPSLVTAIGALVIDLQPPGAKQLVVDLVGTADKLALNLLVAAVALGLAALLGVAARR